MKWHRAPWNSATIMSWANMFVQMVGALIFIPMVMSHWGTLDFGIFLLVASINRFALLFSEQLATTSSMLISFLKSGATNLNPKYEVEDSQSALSEDERVQQRRTLFKGVLGTLGTLLLGISLVVGSVVAVLALLSMLRLAESSSNVTPAQWGAMGVSLLTLFLRINLTKYEIFLRGMDRVALMGKWNAIFGCVGLLLNLLFIQLGFGLLTWAMIFNGTLLANGVRNYWLACADRDRFDIRQAPLWSWDRTTIQALWEPMWRGFIGTVSYVGGDEIVSMLAPFFLDSSNATTFLLYNRLITVVGPISQIPLASRLPYMASLVAQGEMRSLVQFAGKRILFCGILGVLGVNAVGVVAPLFVYYSQKDLPLISLGAWSLVAVFYTFDRGNGLSAIVLLSGNVILMHWRRVVVVICTLLSLFVLFPWLGPVGGFLALYIPRVVFFHFNLYRELCLFLRIKASHFLKPSMCPFLALQLAISIMIGLACLWSVMSDPSGQPDSARLFRALILGK